MEYIFTSKLGVIPTVSEHQRVHQSAHDAQELKYYLFN